MCKCEQSHSPLRGAWKVSALLKWELEACSLLRQRDRQRDRFREDSAVTH